MWPSSTKAGARTCLVPEPRPRPLKHVTHVSCSLLCVIVHTHYTHTHSFGGCCCCCCSHVRGYIVRWVCVCVVCAYLCVQSGHQLQTRRVGRVKRHLCARIVSKSVSSVLVCMHGVTMSPPLAHKPTVHSRNVNNDAAHKTGQINSRLRGRGSKNARCPLCLKWV